MPTITSRRTQTQCTEVSGTLPWDAAPSLDVQRCRSKWEIEDRQIAAKLSIDTSVLAGRL
jgi:hypothetical protein